MGSVITGKYLGGKSVELKHEDSGAIVVTDAPKDNQGEGRQFSPTDLFAASIGACVMTIAAIYAENHRIDLSGMHLRLEKHMGASPRRVVKVPIALHLPASLPDEQRVKIERAVHGCPVHRSIHPDIESEIEFIYDV